MPSEMTLRIKAEETRRESGLVDYFPRLKKDGMGGFRDETPSGPPRRIIIGRSRDGEPSD